MKSIFRNLKSGTSLILIIIFLVACGISMFVFFSAAWVHTFKVFTRETPVAQIRLSELKEDELGEYFEVDVKQIKGRSPLAAIFNPYDETDDELEGVQSFRLYGDEFGIGGPIIRFENSLTFLNFQTVYKLGFVEGVYTNSIEQNARTPDMTQRFDLNGGYETWRRVFDDVRDETFRGQVMEIFIKDLPRIDPERTFVDDEPQDLTLCVTEDGFVFCD